jgi:hypothetical protein
MKSRRCTQTVYKAYKNAAVPTVCLLVCLVHVLSVVVPFNGLTAEGELHDVQGQLVARSDDSNVLEALQSAIQQPGSSIMQCAYTAQPDVQRSLHMSWSSQEGLVVPACVPFPDNSNKAVYAMHAYTPSMQNAWQWYRGKYG